MDLTAFDASTLIPLEVPAGTAVFFNSFLVHRSQPNRSENDRRALLYSYQPAGNPHAREIPRPFKLTDG
jgi:ectoine hydroxylase-related dioxygenase (phytanoyl-CoA dioxygenase family)